MITKGHAEVAFAAVISLACVLAIPNARGQTAARTSLHSGGASHVVTFVVRGLRSDRGRVLGGLFDRPERWVREGQAVATCRTSIRAGHARCAMRVPGGRYAFAFAHDEDDNGQLNRDFFGIPSEGYGFSNDVRPALSLPSWQSAAFVVPGPVGGERVITARYGF